MMKLSELIHHFPGRVRLRSGSPDTAVSAIEYDSRKAHTGSLFVAVKGLESDGHAYIEKAVSAGASAVVVDRGWSGQSSVPVIEADNSREALSYLSAAFWGFPSRKISVVGITGTNGKTSTTYMLESIFRAAGLKPGVIGTVNYRWNSTVIDAPNTTPESADLQSIFGRMVSEGVNAVAMEVSSHGLSLGRADDISFDGGVFTNLTRDHLDYHKTFENYRNAKKAFFDGLPKSAFAITNADDKNGMIMVQNTKATVKTYSIRQMADFRAHIIEMHFAGMYLEVDGHEVGVQFIGKFNVSNLLAVYAAARMLGKEPEEILVALSTLHSVSGRLEPIASPAGFTAIVDYAHTPDALENVLNAIHEVLNGKGHVITVCGAGGNRDHGKRPLMAQEAVKQSDKVIITSDNPRFEEPQAIIDDMVAGLDKEQMKKVITIVDRKEAIKTACMMAQKGDVVLVAGKGHENYQEIKGVKHHFDDKEVLHDIFNN